MGSSLYSLCVVSAFGGRPGFDVSRSHIFTQLMLAAITSVGGGAGDGRARTGARCEAGLPLCLVTITALWSAGTDPKLMEQKP